MSSQPATPQIDSAADRQAALLRQAERLEQLTEAGLRLALAIEEQVTQRSSAEPLSSEALAKDGMTFARVARAVRMTVMLHARQLRGLDEAAARDLDPGAKVQDAEVERLDDEEARSDPVYRRKARVENIVQRVASAHTDDENEVDRLVIEAGDRLDDDDIYGDVLTRPVGELVALICRDLGLDPDWDGLSREAWAQAEIESGVEGSPFANLPRSWQRSAGGGPPADPGDSRREERGVEGASDLHLVPSSAPERHLYPSG